jgi:ATP-dependent Clp protease ATP-binding subunit ClpA
MNISPEIESIIDKSVNIAQAKQHQYVTTEHLLLALVLHPPFKKTLLDFGVEVELLQQDLNSYLDRITADISSTEDAAPRKTHALERLFNRANVQVMFTGRRALTKIDSSP